MFSKFIKFLIVFFKPKGPGRIEKALEGYERDPKSSAARLKLENAFNEYFHGKVSYYFIGKIASNSLSIREDLFLAGLFSDHLNKHGKEFVLPNKKPMSWKSFCLLSSIIAMSVVLFSYFLSGFYEDVVKKLLYEIMPISVAYLIFALFNVIGMVVMGGVFCIFTKLLIKKAVQKGYYEDMMDLVSRAKGWDEYLT